MSKRQLRRQRKLNKKEEMGKLGEEKTKNFEENIESKGFGEIWRLVNFNINRMHTLYIRWKTAQNSLFVDKFSDFTLVWLHWLHFDIIEYSNEFSGKPI